MNKKIFRSSFTVAIVVLISTVVLILGILYNFFDYLKLDNQYIVLLFLFRL